VGLDANTVVIQALKTTPTPLGGTGSAYPRTFRNVGSCPVYVNDNSALAVFPGEAFRLDPGDDFTTGDPSAFYASVRGVNNGLVAWLFTGS